VRTLSTRSYAVDDAWRWRALAWSTRRFRFVAGFANGGVAYPHGAFPNRLLAGDQAVIDLNDPVRTPADFFADLPGLARQSRLGLAGHLGYDLKNQIGPSGSGRGSAGTLTSRHPDRLDFADAFFFAPALAIDFDTDLLKPDSPGTGRVSIRADEPDAVFAAIGTEPEPPDQPPALGPIRCRTRPIEYLDTVRRIQDYILAGEVYELTYCVEFFVEQARLDPVTVFRALTARSPMPFSVFLQVDNTFLLCASPERFLQKSGDQLISQPIKGTIGRGATAADDEARRQQLRHSPKEQAENLMIVDLVRNDLARSAVTGSVRVEELFGIYSFRQVHQLISTVGATLRPGLSWADALRHAFPMGSMTGAPKIRAMQLIDELETSRRGLFSGAVGFISPGGDFDFNVVIRSLLYHAGRQYASFSVGSAITCDADPAQEWAECLLKASALREVLQTLAE
jgi:para-aminobenzoate synthetase component I